MKKLLSLLICLCLVSSAIVISADEPYVKINDLKYDEYMFGETIVISGSTNLGNVIIAVFPPEDSGGFAKLNASYTRTKFSEGVEFPTGSGNGWPEGTWTIKVGSGTTFETITFFLTETVDRTPATTKPTGGEVPTVTTITPDKIRTTLIEGESEKINVTTRLSSFTVDVEDKSVISASLSGKTITITALKRGTSSIWLRAGNNYTTIKVTVNPKPYVEEIPTVQPTEQPTEEPTEQPTEAPTPAAPEEPAADDPLTAHPASHWAKENILTLYKKGIIKGMSKTIFAPETQVTRAQFIKMLVSSCNISSVSTASPFSDVSETEWFYAPIMAAYDNNIIDKGATSFSPNEMITREDMATFAYKAALASNVSFSAEASALFDDHDQIADYAVEAVYAMKSKGIINGMSRTTFAPKGFATRAQAAKIISLLLQLM